MKMIASFQINHDTLTPGMYVSRVDGDIITYDLRMKTPNQGDYLQNAGLHTIEHLFATYVRNSPYSDDIVYVGPMGCRTGFYFLTRDTLPKETALKLLIETFAFIAAYEGEIPGTQKVECGNHLDHDPYGAKGEAALYLTVLNNWSEGQMAYPA